MLTLLWNLSAATRSYLRFYMPTNRAVDWLRSPRGRKWAIPVALVATPVYLGLTALAIQFAARPGLGWLNVLVFLYFWNATKFAWMAVLSLPLLLGRAILSATYWPRDFLAPEQCAGSDMPQHRHARHPTLPRPVGCGLM